jgi:two-component system nitrogen regulation response regulator NtrX
MAYDILIVDDEADIRDLVSGILEDEGYATRTAKDGFEALEQMRLRQPSLVILDVWLGDSAQDGLMILDTLKKDHPFVPVVMISGHGNIETAVSAIKKGAYDFVEKPFKMERLILVVQRAIESAHLKRENAELKVKARMTSGLIGSTPAIAQIRNTVETAAQSNGRVFISGPMGSGKESIARQIHGLSKRAGGPFVAVKCSELHPSQIEAELFGADIMGLDPSLPRKIGMLEKAHNGTLYFDEITQLSLPIQNKIVRVLQEQSFTRVGSNERTQIDVRFLGGTSENVHQLIADGHFREDFFYRMSVTHIHIPPLNERLVDLPHIASHILDEACAAQGISPRKFTNDALILMQAYGWPGDIQQLKNVIDWVLLSGSHDAKAFIDKDKLPKEILSGNSFNSNWRNKSAEILVLPLREAREAFEREYLLAQVNRFSGNISRTARFVGMERSALHRKLRTLGVQEHKGLMGGDEDEPTLEEKIGG